MNNSESCTWKDCQSRAMIPQTVKDGVTWANLCERHAKELDEAIDSFEPPKMLRTWILAQGGAEKMAKEMTKKWNGG